jgi:transcriptional regulator NrdR family protein
MANQVVKADGAREPFNEGKIKNSIELACGDAGIGGDKMAEIVNGVLPAVLEVAAAKDEIATAEIKAAILKELDGLEPSVSAAWRKYDEGKGK